MEKLIPIVFIVPFVYCELMLSPTDLTWEESNKQYDLLSREVLCDNTTLSSCAFVLKDEDFNINGDFTAWVKGYVIKSPFMNSIGCFNVSSETLQSPNIIRKEISNNDVRSCALSCGFSLYYGLTGNTCICINSTIDGFTQLKRGECTVKCPGKTDETCGGEADVLRILTVYAVTNTVLGQSCQSVPQKGLVKNATANVYNGTNGFIRCHTQCSFHFAIEGDNCYCLTDVTLTTKPVDNGLCNQLCSGNMFERCGGSPVIPPYHFVTLYQTLSGTEDTFTGYGEDCVAVVRNGDNYGTVPQDCNDRNRFICNSASIGREYVRIGASWEDAKKHCDTQRDGLAIEFYYQNLDLLRFYWIGYFRVSSNIWDNDLPFDQNKHRTDCLALSRTGRIYMFKLVNCNTRLSALCMTERGVVTISPESSISPTSMSTTSTSYNSTPEDIRPGNPARVGQFPLTTVIGIAIGAGLLLALIVISIIVAYWKRKSNAPFKSFKSTQSSRSFEFRKMSRGKNSYQGNIDVVENGNAIVPGGMGSQELYDEIPYAGTRKSRIQSATNMSYDDVIIGTNGGASVIFDAKRADVQKPMDNKGSTTSVKDTNSDGLLYQILESSDDAEKMNTAPKNIQSRSKLELPKSTPQTDSQPPVYHALEDMSNSQKGRSTQDTSVRQECPLYHDLEETVPPRIENVVNDDESEGSLYNGLNDHNVSTNNPLTTQIYDHI